MWNRIVKFFKDSEVIFLARLQVFMSLVGAVAVSFDWSPLATGTMPTRQQYTLCGILFAQGVATEYCRRRRSTQDNDGHLTDTMTPGRPGR
jgi:hypothetical protein